MANQSSLATRWSGRCRTAGISAAICLLTGGLAIAQPDTWTTLRYPTPAPGVDRTYCIDLNDRGDMVGWRVAPNKAFVLQDGEYYDLHPAAAASSLAHGINAHGDIVGDYTVAGVTIGAVWSKGTLLPIEFSGNIMTHLRGINARGDIVGFTMETNTSPYRGFLLRSDGEVIDVQYSKAISTGVFGINDKGDMVGEYSGSDGTTRGFLKTKGGDFLSLEYPGATFTSAPIGQACATSSTLSPAKNLSSTMCACSASSAASLASASSTARTSTTRSASAPRPGRPPPRG